MENSLSSLMDKANRALINRLQGLFVNAGYDITVEQAIIMSHLWKQNGFTQQYLADKVGKDKTTVSGIITSLEKKNLIVRVPGENDKRQKRIFLTETGKKMKNDLEPLMLQNLKYAQQTIDPEHIKICKDVLRAIINRLKT